MTTDINTLLTALYVKIDDWLGTHRRAGRPPRLSDAELLTLAVAQALLGIRSEARWLRFLPKHLPARFRICLASPDTTNDYGRRYRC